MANPYRPGSVYYIDLPPDGLCDNETRNNPQKGPRPWILLYSRQHKQTKVVLAAPMYSKGSKAIPSHHELDIGDFDVHDSRLSAPKWVKLEQLRALDTSRISAERGPLAHMKKAALARLRSNLVGMLDPRHLP